VQDVSEVSQLLNLRTATRFFAFVAIDFYFSSERIGGMPAFQNTTHANTYENLFNKSKVLLLWTAKKAELSENYEKQNKDDRGRPYVSMGEIYNAYLGSNIGSEIDKERPVLIFQGNDQYIRRSNIVLAIPISSNTNLKPYRVLFSATDILDNKGVSDGVIIIQQIRSISKTRLKTLKGQLSPAKLKEVARGIGSLLYKDMPLLLEEGDAQTTVSGAAKMHSENAT